MSDLNTPVNPVKGFTYSSRGWIVPCCHVDSTINDPYFELYGILDEHLKLENVESVEEILESPEWKEFHRVLLEDPENAPDGCKVVCGRCRS